MAKEGIRHLGYSAYLGNALAIFKVLGALLLLLPHVPNRIKNGRTLASHSTLFLPPSAFGQWTNLEE